MAIEPQMVIHDGKVALQHYNSNPCTVKIEEDNTYYSFVPKNNVSLALIEPKHVDALLRQLARMCCGKKQKKFFPASPINFNLWMYNSRHAPEE